MQSMFFSGHASISADNSGQHSKQSWTIFDVELAELQLVHALQFHVCAVHSIEVLIAHLEDGCELQKLFLCHSFIFLMLLFCTDFVAQSAGNAYLCKWVVSYMTNHGCKDRPFWSFVQTFRSFSVYFLMFLTVRLWRKLCVTRKNCVNSLIIKGLHKKPLRSV